MSASATSTASLCESRRDSFCAYMRTSASCIASAAEVASRGTETAPQAALTSKPVPRAVSASASR